MQPADFRLVLFCLVSVFFSAVEGGIQQRGFHFTDLLKNSETTKCDTLKLRVF